MHKLTFDEQILPSATKPIGVNELLKRLKVLSAELGGLEQENTDRDSLTTVSLQLASTNILQHKNRGIAAYASCCIADLLRLCAPDAPYSQGQLKAIFECFIKQLKGLDDIECTYYQQYYYLLESLSTVESIVLLGDIDKGDALIVELFRTFFDLAKGHQQRNNTQAHMVAIMVQLVDEIPQLSQDVLEVLLASIMSTKTFESSFTSSDGPREMAKSVVSSCADRLQRNICQYFSDVIFSESQSHDSTEDPNSDHSPLSRAHRLAYELFKVAPSTLQNVIPQLETELFMEDVLFRTLATQAVSRMLASSNGRLLVQQYSTAYKAWTGRRNDKSIAVRAMWVEGIGQIINGDEGAVRLVEVENMCIDGLLTRLVDADERVRSSACSVIENTSYDIAKKRFTPSLLQTFFDRCRDKKFTTQEAAFRHIGRLFDWAYEDITCKDEKAVEKFSPMVNNILHCVYINDQSLNVLLERTLFEDILNLSQSDDELRTKRLLHVVSLADEKSRRAFFALVGPMQILYARYLAHFVKCCESHNGGVMEGSDSALHERLGSCVKAIAHKMPDPSAAETALLLFAKRNDRRSYRLLAECVDSGNEYKSVRKYLKECIKRAAQISPQVGETIEIILRRATYQVFNKSNVIPLNNICVGEHGEIADAARLVLVEMAATHPSMYKAHVQPMSKQITNDPSGTTAETLKAFAQFAQSSPMDVPNDDAFCRSLEYLIKAGSPQQAKYAVSIVSNLPGRREHLIQSANSIMDELAFGRDKFLTGLAAIAQISLLAPDCIEDRSSEITSFCAQELLMRNRAPFDMTDVAEQWSEHVTEECVAKCYAVKILGNRLRAYQAADTAAELARPVFKALRSIVVNMGELFTADSTAPSIRARLRLEAAKMFLKLATLPIYEKMISVEDFNQIALFAQDLEFNVRRRFLNRLSKYLMAKKLTPRWHVIMFLAAHDPEDAIKRETRTRAAAIATQHSKCSSITDHIGKLTK